MKPLRTYLDHNATSPLRPEARTAMLRALELTGNASSVHAEGRRARAIVETAREQVARLVGAKPSEVIFTSGATEANNLAFAAGWAMVCVSAIEHDSVRIPAQTSGARLVEIPVAADGAVNLLSLRASLSSTTVPGPALLSLQLANNETGAVQPVDEAVALAVELGLKVHSDAVQAMGRVPVDFAGLGLDALSLSSHKIGGPMGAGALIARDGFPLKPLIAGGGQERRRRAGTENVAAIAGFGAAAEAAVSDLSSAERIAELRDRLEREAIGIAPGCVVVAAGVQRLPNTTCLVLPGHAAETTVIRLDLAGIAVSAGAACSSGKVGASPVLTAMGLPAAMVRSAIRISLGWNSCAKDVDAFLAAWADIVNGTGRRAVA
jgi:cysteine desulfurase